MATTNIPTPVPPPVPTLRPSSTVIAGLVLVVILGATAAFFLYQLAAQTAQSANTNTVKNTNVETGNTNLNANSNTNTTTNTNTATNVNTSTNTNSSIPTAPMPKGTVTATFIAPKKVADLKLIGKTDGIATYTPPVYYQIGTLTSGKYAGQKLVMVHFFFDGPQQYPTVEYYAVNGAKGTMLVKPSNPTVPNQYNTLDNVIQGYKQRNLTYDATTTIDKLYAPDTLIGPKAGQILVRDPYPTGFFDGTGLIMAFTDPIYGPVYHNPTPPARDTPAELMSQVTINQRYGFYLKMADGTIAVYQLKLDFVT